jgi:LuxR family maltose regulon positive regulatory protein
MTTTFVRRLALLPLTAKLTAPELRPGLVPRQSLLHRLAGSSDVPVVLLTAPAGYGKTTLLRQWTEADPRPCAWVQIDESDNDLEDFLRCLIEAMRCLRELDEPTVGSAAESSAVAAIPYQLANLAAMLHEAPTCVLVLDGVDRLTNTDCLNVLGLLERELPLGSQLALAGRGTPAFPWGSLQARGRLVKLGAPDLAFSVEEAHDLLTAMDLNVPMDDVVLLAHQTEGWPAGLYLAAASHGSPEPSGAAVSGEEAKAVLALGDETALGDYLRDELLAGLSPKLVTFLIRTSVLGTLTPSLCDAVLSRHGSGVVLRDLQRANLFLFPLDAREGRYRYHRLFARMLQSELRQREPQVEPELHARASIWLERHGNLTPAIRHARASGETTRAARLVWSNTAAYLFAGRRFDVERWLAEFPSAEVLVQPLLSLAAAWCAVESGRPPEPWLAQARRASAPDRREAGVAATALAVLRAVLARDGIAQMRRDALAAEHLARADDPWRTVAQLFHGTALLLSGDRDGARALLENAERLACVLGAHSPRACILGELSLIAIEQDDWYRARTLAHQAMAIMDDHELGDLATLSSPVSVISLVLTHQGLVAEARRWARQARQAMARCTVCPPWNGIQTRLVLARTYLLLGDAPAARTLLCEAQNLLSQLTDAPALRAWLDDAWRMAESLPVTTGVGPTALTTAELRVLQFLPSHLTFGEIGSRLHLSRNTVKTQAISAYRKLGVSSRTEAVEQAHRCGFLPEGERFIRSA